ncbi:hypothetical protein [Paenibacillus sp. NPDC058071]|uniref:hypothetical protein n=1 Tax=Paenibacillus sp. NPDC058071 TaxID=3346326 RepID=UPI0036DA1068
MLDLIVKYGITIVFFGALTCLIFALFKLPIKHNDKQIALFAVIVGSISFYFKYIVESPYVFAYQVITFVILLIVLRRYPVLYAIIVASSGFVAVSLVDGTVTLTLQALNLFNSGQLAHDLRVYSLLHITITIMYMLITYALLKLDIGFSFVKRRFSGKHQLSNINYVWSFLLIASMLFMTVLTQPAVIESLNLYIILLVTILFLGSTRYAYKQNKVSLQDRFGKEAE